MAYFKWLFKSIFCKHRWVFLRGVYGDEINHSNGKRVQEYCHKCDSVRYANKPIPKPGDSV